jgi:hypothetical protein
MHCIVYIYSPLQYHVNQCYMFRPLIESPSEIHAKLTFHKTKLTIHIKKI